jgi:hypothetical protein
VCALKKPGLGLARVGERTALEPEQLGLQQGFRNGGAVHVDKGSRAAGTGPMNHMGDETLAGRGFTLQQDRGKPRGV